MTPFLLNNNGRTEQAVFLSPEEAKALRNVDLRGVAKIKRTVADFYNIPPSIMEDHDRVRKYARPRQIAMYLAREIEHKSYPWIAATFGNRDHTTALHAYRQVSRLVVTNENTAAEIAEIRKALGA